LKKVLGNARISLDELNTVLAEVECILNSRPLSYMSDEADGEVLTPSHLLVGHRLLTLPTGVETNLKLDESDNEYVLSKRFLYLTRLLSHFWNRWRREYLTDLRETHKLNNNKPVDISPGDVVLVHEDYTKRAQWKVAIVEELIRGKDNEVRGARIRKAGKGKHEILNRPVQKLIPLECAVKDCQKRKNEEESIKRDKKMVKELPAFERPQRIAAKDARLKTRFMLDY